MIYQEVTFNDFVDAFKAYNRFDAWSYDGLEMLYEHLLELADNTEPIILDVIALDGEYVYYEDEEEMLTDLADYDEEDVEYAIVASDERGIVVCLALL